MESKILYVLKADTVSIFAVDFSSQLSNSDLRLCFQSKFVRTKQMVLLVEPWINWVLSFQPPNITTVGAESRPNSKRTSLESRCGQTALKPTAGPSNQSTFLRSEYCTTDRSSRQMCLPVRLRIMIRP